MNEDTTGTPTPSAPTDQLGDLMDRYEEACRNGDTVSVSLSRITPNGKEPVRRFDGDSFDPYTCADDPRVGPGRYFARLKVNGHWKGAATFPANVSGKAPPPPPPPPPQPAAPAQPFFTAPPSRDGELSPSMMFQAMMQMQMAQSQQTTGILTAIIGKPSPSSGNVSELIDGLKKLQDLSGTGGDEGADGELGEILEVVRPLVGPLVRALESRQNRSPEVNNGQRRNVRVRDRNSARQTRPDVRTRMVRAIVECRKARRSPQTTAAVLLETLQQDSNGEALAAMLPQMGDATLIRELSAEVKALALPVHRVWILAVIRTLRASVTLWLNPPADAQVDDEDLDGLDDLGTDQDGTDDDTTADPDGEEGNDDEDDQGEDDEKAQGPSGGDGIGPGQS